MRPFRGLLLLGCEIAEIAFGLAFSVLLAGVSATLFRSRENVAIPMAFLLGLLLTIVGFVAMRRTRPWRLECDVARWALARAERKQHPTRARYRRIAVGISVWVPSMIAALVLFFFPVATHLLEPGSQYFRHFRVPVPWTFTVFPGRVPAAGHRRIDAIFSSTGRGRFGMTTIPIAPYYWHELQPISQVVFESSMNADTSEYFGMMEVRRRGATDVLNKELRLGDVAFTCWQYRPEKPHHQLFWPDLWLVWRVDCGTPEAVHQQRLYARFSGREEDLGAFYQLIESVRSVE
jgi:hypothetical protein